MIPHSTIQKRNIHTLRTNMCKSASAGEQPLDPLYHISQHGHGRGCHRGRGHEADLSLMSDGGLDSLQCNFTLEAMTSLNVIYLQLQYFLCIFVKGSIEHTRIFTNLSPSKEIETFGHNKGSTIKRAILLMMRL